MTQENRYNGVTTQEQRDAWREANQDKVCQSQEMYEEEWAQIKQAQQQEDAEREQLMETLSQVAMAPQTKRKLKKVLLPATTTEDAERPHVSRLNREAFVKEADQTLKEIFEESEQMDRLYQEVTQAEDELQKATKQE